MAYPNQSCGNVSEEGFPTAGGSEILKLSFFGYSVPREHLSLVRKKETSDFGIYQCFGSGLHPDSIRSVDPYPVRIQEGKNDPQKYKKIRNFMFKSAGYSLSRAEGFFCSLDIPFSNFWTSKPWIRIRSGSGSVFSLKCWIQIRIRIK
jgi:hypothetical protein